MDESKLLEFSKDIATKWYIDDYHGTVYLAADIVEQFIIWLYKDGKEIKDVNCVG